MERLRPCEGCFYRILTEFKPNLKYSTEKNCIYPHTTLVNLRAHDLRALYSRYCQPGLYRNTVSSAKVNGASGAEISSVLMTEADEWLCMVQKGYSLIK